MLRMLKVSFIWFSFSLCLDDVFYLLWWSFKLQYISRLYSSLNVEIIIYDSSSKVKQQFSHRRMTKNFIWSFLAVLTIILLRNIKLKNVLLKKRFSNFNLQKPLQQNTALLFKIKNLKKWQYF